MNSTGKDKRQAERYDMEAKIFFQVTYDIRTKVRFQIIDDYEEKIPFRKYFAFSRNVCAGGICFTSEKKLEKGDHLYLEVYLPQSENPVKMEGEVRWSETTTSDQKKSSQFDSGVKLKAVEGKSVIQSIYYDDSNKIIWSAVLESMFGTFRIMKQRRREAKKKNQSQEHN